MCSVGTEKRTVPTGSTPEAASADACCRPVAAFGRSVGPADLGSRRKGLASVRRGFTPDSSVAITRGLSSLNEAHRAGSHLPARCVNAPPTRTPAAMRSGAYAASAGCSVVAGAAVGAVAASTPASANSACSAASGPIAFAFLRAL